VATHLDSVTEYVACSALQSCAVSREKIKSKNGKKQNFFIGLDLHTVDLVNPVILDNSKMQKI
jgi:hypothetical protein